MKPDQQEQIALGRAAFYIQVAMTVAVVVGFATGWAAHLVATMW